MTVDLAATSSGCGLAARDQRLEEPIRFVLRMTDVPAVNSCRVGDQQTGDLLVPTLIAHEGKADNGDRRSATERWRSVRVR